MLPLDAKSDESILKSGRKVVLNETVCLADISVEEIQSIHASCKKAFGIIQANAEFPHPNASDTVDACNWVFRNKCK